MKTSLNLNNAEERFKRALDKLRPVIIRSGEGHTIKHKGVTSFIPFTQSNQSTSR